MSHIVNKTAKDAEQNVIVPNTPMQFLWYVSKPHLRFLFGGFFVVTVADLIRTGIPYIFKLVIDTAGQVEAGTAGVADMWQWISVYLGAVLVMFLSWRLSGFIGMEWASRANATAYTTLFQYLSHHSHTYFSNRFAGSLSSKVTHASEGIQSLCEAFIWNYYPSILSLIATAVFMWFASAKAALIFIALIALLVPLNIFLAAYRRPHVVRYSAQATRARGYAVDAITNMAAVRQYARMKDEQEMFTEHINTMRTLNIRQWRISEWGLLLNNVIIVTFELALLFVVVSRWGAGAMSIGELIMILSLLVSIQGTLVFIGMSMNGFIRRFSEVQEGLSDILVEHDIMDAENAQPLTIQKGVITWQNVTFGFGTRMVFSDFSLTIQKGERVGLVGASGAGKTTFVSLLLRQHELTGGSIYIDGQDIKGVTQDSLREHIAVVPQEPMLFHRSIRDNIVYGKPHATDEEVIAVAKKAQVHDFVSALEDGYDTIVGERGVKLSGGQKQRIAIARAMLKNAPILILDEATSALDSESEAAIQKALHELMEAKTSQTTGSSPGAPEEASRGKTVIAIAHRLSTLREMDRIIVLHEGRIVEDGIHETLAQAGGTYARLWEHQAGGFLQE